MAQNKMTIAGVKRLANAIDAPVAVGAGRALTPADHGKILNVSTALTVTIPQDVLPPGFKCQFVAPASGNLSLDPLGTVTLNGGTSTLTRARASYSGLINFAVIAANVAVVDTDVTA